MIVVRCVDCSIDLDIDTTDVLSNVPMSSFFFFFFPCKVYPGYQNLYF